MCSPTLAFSALSTVVSFVQAGQQADTEAEIAKNQADFEQGKAKYNARVSENAAQQTINAGVEKENALRLKTARLKSQQKTQLGAFNVNVNTGSAFQLQQDTETLGEADALRIRSNTLNQADALSEQSNLLEAEGEYAQIAGRNKASAAKAAGRNKQIGSVLSFGKKVAGSGVADKWFTPSSSANVSSNTFRGDGPLLSYRNK